MIGSPKHSLNTEQAHDLLNQLAGLQMEMKHIGLDCIADHLDLICADFAVEVFGNLPNGPLNLGDLFK